jgi:hypothetical protein
VSISARFEAIRIELDDHEQCHDNTHMLRRHLGELRREIADLETWKHRYEAVRLTLTFHEGAAAMADRYAAGSPVPASVKALNREGEQVPDTVTWTASSGTVTTDDTTLSTTIDGADVGTLTVTVTDPGGLSVTGSVEIYDGTPASLELSFN